MSFSSKHRSLVRYVLAAVAGALLTLAFPKPAVAGAAWIAPGLLLFSALGATSKQAFRLGFVGGVVHFLSSLSWLLNIPYTFHGIPLSPALGWIALSAYVALFPAVWVWLCWKLFNVLGQNRGACDGSQDAIRGSGSLMYSLASIGFCRRTVWLFLCAVIWVGLEVLRGRFLTGFPWNFVGASQYKLVPLIQVASITGIYGVSFIVVWVSVSIVSASLLLARMPLRKALIAGELFFPLLALAFVISFGANRIFSERSEQGRELRLALVQPSIPQTVIWDPTESDNRFQTVLELSEQALTQNPDLLIWPESAFPGFTAENQRAISRLLDKHKVWLILCADAVEPHDTGGQPKYFNSSFIISPEGKLTARYDKKRLVIFGEYLPLAKWLPFLKWFTPVEDGFTAGSKQVQFEMPDLQAATSVLICFEDMFPHEAREHVLAGTDFLLNLTNDGWFGEGAAQWQQAVSGLFRAVENGVPLVRCTNNGLTCWIDQFGRIRKVGADNGEIYGRGVAIVNVPCAAEDRSKATFYNQHGDVFGWTCFGISLVAFGSAAVKRRQKRTASELSKSCPV